MGNIIVKNNVFHTCSPYYKDEFNVYYNNRKVEEATAMTFKDLGNCYGKDAFDVFYKGYMISGADADSFIVDIDGLHAHDNFYTYFKGQKLI
jgi:hypothetical protein